MNALCGKVRFATQSENAKQASEEPEEKFRWRNGKKLSSIFAVIEIINASKYANCELNRNCGTITQHGQCEWQHSHRPPHIRSHLHVPKHRPWLACTASVVVPLISSKRTERKICLWKTKQANEWITRRKKCHLLADGMHRLAKFLLPPLPPPPQPLLLSRVAAWRNSGVGKEEGGGEEWYCGWPNGYTLAVPLQSNENLLSFMQINKG